MPSVIQNSYILLAPALFAATIYMILGLVINLTEGNKYSIVSARRLNGFSYLAISSASRYKVAVSNAI
jgi:hypothetical protein